MRKRKECELRAQSAQQRAQCSREILPTIQIHCQRFAEGESLTQDAAENDILPHVFAPVHDPDAAERLFEIIERVVRRTKIFRMRKPSIKREVSFNWDGTRAAAGFAPPSL